MFSVLYVGVLLNNIDALNVHNYTHGVHARETFQLPYTSGRDRRLKVNATEFLPSTVYCDSINSVLACCSG